MGCSSNSGGKKKIDPSVFGGGGGGSDTGSKSNDGDRGGLKSFEGRSDGYKKDGRGTWSDNGTHNIRHSVDKNADGSMTEHVVIKDKSTGYTEKRSETYPSSGGA